MVLSCEPYFRTYSTPCLLSITTPVFELLIYSFIYIFNNEGSTKTERHLSQFLAKQPLGSMSLPLYFTPVEYKEAQIMSQRSLLLRITQGAHYSYFKTDSYYPFTSYSSHWSIHAMYLTCLPHPKTPTRRILQFIIELIHWIM